MSERQDDLLTALQSRLDDTVLFVGDRIPEKARSDASLSGHDLPWAYVRPTALEHITAALSACHAHGRAVTIQGGMTGLAGGANPERHDVVIALDRFSGIEEIDTAAGTMTVKAGTVLEVAQKAAEEAGFLLPIDLGARGSCQIGGNIATNAGGIRVIRHGVTRDNILGLEAVLADGTVISSLNRLRKNNTGYDLKQLFIGSEGTLGVITRAVIRLQPLPVGKVTALVALSTYDAAVRLLTRAQAGLAGLTAFEIMWESYVSFSSKAEGLTLFDRSHPFAVIIEQSGAPDAEALETFLGGMFEEGLIEDALLAVPGVVAVQEDTLNKKLRALGIPPRLARASALIALTQELPPVVLSRLTGLEISSAIAWSNAVAATNSSYAAAVLDRVSATIPILTR